ncbi:hypothetical protein N7486_009723 [Penicillium sp. IBT 16267x]|nr:hypothetical protein N7486_009723 [Penicillium sp. IBT 16267x]
MLSSSQTPLPRIGSWTLDLNRLTSRLVDDLTGENLEEFEEAYKEFLDIFKEEEKLFPPINNIYSYRITIIENTRKAYSTSSINIFIPSLHDPTRSFPIFRELYLTSRLPMLKKLYLPSFEIRRYINSRFVNYLMMLQILPEMELEGVEEIFPLKFGAIQRKIKLYHQHVFPLNNSCWGLSIYSLLGF